MIFILSFSRASLKTVDLHLYCVVYGKVVGRLFFQLLFDCKKYFKYLKNFWLTSGGRRGKILLLVCVGSQEET